VLTLAERLKFELRHRLYIQRKTRKVLPNIPGEWHWCSIDWTTASKKSRHGKNYWKWSSSMTLVESGSKRLFLHWMCCAIQRSGPEKIAREKKADRKPERFADQCQRTGNLDLFIVWAQRNLRGQTPPMHLISWKYGCNHNHASMSTWEKIEYEMSYMMDKHTDFDETIFELSNW